MRSSVLVSKNRKRYFVFCLAFEVALLLGGMPRTQAAPNMANRFDQITDSTASAVAVHRFGFTYTNTIDPVGSVTFEFCANSPLVDLPCTVPSGLGVSAAALVSQSGQTGFSINGASSTANKLVLSRPAQVPSPSSTTSVYEFGNITNPDTAGSYYVRLQTFASTNGTGPALEEGGVVFAINEAFDVSAEVPPYIKFCSSVTITDFDCGTATSFFIDFGEFSVTRPKFASSQMVLATNAGLGFSISLSGTTLTSGNNIIPALTVPTPSSPGISQFGLNLRANGAPGIGADPIGPGVANVASSYGVPNLFKFVPAEVIVSGTGTTDHRKFTVSYIANVSSSQPAGIYATTISYIALANF